MLRVPVERIDSAMTVPLKSPGLAGRRTRMRVLYGIPPDVVPEMKNSSWT